jgi:ABC-2 type transport system ATP-binding protein
LAIVGDPRLLLLDEPTSALDVDARLRFWDQVRELAGRGRTILLSTHNMAEAQTLAQRVVLVNRGAIVADGTPGEVAALTGVQTMRLLSTAPEEALRVLFATGRQVRNLTVADADLESAFVALVHADTHAAASTSTVQEQK